MLDLYEINNNSDVKEEGKKLLRDKLKNLKHVTRGMTNSVSVFCRPCKKMKFTVEKFFL